MPGKKWNSFAFFSLAMAPGFPGGPISGFMRLNHHRENEMRQLLNLTAAPRLRALFALAFRQHPHPPPRRAPYEYCRTDVSSAMRSCQLYVHGNSARRLSSGRGGHLLLAIRPCRRLATAAPATRMPTSRKGGLPSRRSGPFK